MTPASLPSLSSMDACSASITVWEASAAAGSDGKHPTAHQHPTGRPCHCDTPGGMPIPRRLPGSRTERSNLFISAPTFKQLQSNRELVDSALLAPKQYTHTHTRAYTRNEAHTHALGPAHVEAIILLLVKSLLYSLLFSQARESNLSTKEC